MMAVLGNYAFGDIGTAIDWRDCATLFYENLQKVIFKSGWTSLTAKHNFKSFIIYCLQVGRNLLCLGRLES
jgi:hypothetical protein